MERHIMMYLLMCSCCHYLVVGGVREGQGNGRGWVGYE